MKLTLDALVVLDAITQKGSFAAAANALYRVPSTVTYSVQKLEEDLGFVIFQKEGRRSVLTPAGKVLLEQGRELLLAADRIVETAHKVDSGWESTLNITLDTLWDINNFYPLVVEFYKLNTGVEVNLSEEVLGGSIDAIVEHRADIVIGSPAPVNNIKGIKFQQIFNVSWQFVVAKDHPLTTLNRTLTEEDIAPYTSIVIKDSSQNTPIISHRIFEKKNTLRVATMEQKIIAQMQGVGVGFLPTHKIETYLKNNSLIALPINKVAEDTPQYCAWHTNNKSKAMRWFLNKLL